MEQKVRKMESCSGIKRMWNKEACNKEARNKEAYDKEARNKEAWKRRIGTLLLCAVTIGCLFLMWTLCADEGIDYDESYSFKSARDYTELGIVQKMIEDNDTDVPLYYCVLRIWNLLFGKIGHRFLAARLFSVAGALASMLLGLFPIRKLWGNKTALFYILAVGAAPAMLHVNVNIRMYSWTNFLVTASAILIYRIVQETEADRLGNWILLWILTFSALFSHYFTCFAYLALYLYLCIALLLQHRKALWKAVVTGGSGAGLLVVWMVVSGFFHFVESDGQAVEMKKISLTELLNYLFSTQIPYSVAMGVLLVVVALAGAVFFVKTEKKSQKAFILTAILGIFVIYVTALALSSFASHFFTARHIMHVTALMWLGIAIVLPRINWKIYGSGLMLLAALCWSNYQSEYESAYRDTPYLEATKEFIANEMEPGDIVIYSSPKMYGTLYSCYMPEQTFIHLKNVGDIQELAGKRVWYFSTNWTQYFSDEDVERYGITAENVGHYGFQIMEGFTDFDLLRLEIRGAE